MEYTDIKDLKKLMGQGFAFEENGETGSIDKSMVTQYTYQTRGMAGEDSDDEDSEDDEYNITGTRYSLQEEEVIKEESDEEDDSFFDAMLTAGRGAKPPREEEKSQKKVDRKQSKGKSGATNGKF